MKNYPFNPDTLLQYSESNPFGSHNSDILNQLNSLKQSLRFPAVLDDVGKLMSLLVEMTNVKTIFEFGSGYGHSCYWYLPALNHLEKIVLTEKRDDLKEHFKSIPWPSQMMDIVDYHQGDAFEKVEQLEQIDFALVDGVKADYLKFLKIMETKISKNGMVLIDNAFWRGSFLDKEACVKNKSAKHIKDLHDYIAESSFWQSSFVPFRDGVILLRPKTI